MVKSGLRAAAVFLLLFLILFSRRPDALTNPQFFAEDGRVFFHDQALFGSGEALIIPYAGYLSTIPRLTAIAGSWVPVAAAPLVYNTLALLVAALCCGLFFLPAFRFIVASDALRLAACCVMAAGLDSAELVGTITEIQWYLQLAAILILLYSATRKPPIAADIAMAVVMLLLALSAPTLIVAVPIALWLLIRGPGGKLVPAALLVGVGVQTLIYLNAGTTRGTAAAFRLGGLAKSGLDYVVFRDLISAIAGRPEAFALSESHKTFVVVLGAAGVLAWLGWLWLRSAPRVRLGIVTAAYLALSSAAISIGARDLPGGHLTFGGERYFYLGACCTVVLAAMTFDRLRGRWRWVGPVALLLLFAGGLAGNYRVPPFAPLQWDVYAKRVTSWLEAMHAGVPLRALLVPVNSPGWYFTLDGSVLDNGDFERVPIDPWIPLGSITTQQYGLHEWQGLYSLAMWGSAGDVTQLVRGIRPGARMRAAAVVDVPCASGVSGALLLEDGRGHSLAAVPADAAKCGSWQKLTAHFEVTGSRRVFVRLHYQGNGQKVFWDQVELEPDGDRLAASWDVPSNRTPVPRYGNGTLQWGVPVQGHEPPTIELGVFRTKETGVRMELLHQSCDVLLEAMGGIGGLGSEPGDQMVMGDWTGNGMMRLGVFRKGTWYLDLNGNRRWDGVEGGDAIYRFGLAGDVAVVGDWVGDGAGHGITRLGVFRCAAKSVCTWVLDKGGTAVTAQYGLEGDIPVVSRWKAGDRADHIGVFRNGTWIVDSNGDNMWEPDDATYAFGLPGDVPVISHTRRNLGVFRRGVWVLDTNGNHAWDPADATVQTGSGDDQPVIGEW